MRKVQRILAVAAMTVGLLGTTVGTASAAPADISHQLPLSVALAKAELPPVGGWSEPHTLVKPPGGYDGPCWDERYLLGELDGVYSGASVPHPGAPIGYYTAQSLVLRYASTAKANAAAEQWRGFVANCEIPVNPAGNGSLYILNVRKVATVSGVEVWGYEEGASGYQSTSNYRQFFLVQRENVLYIFWTDDYSTLEPHPVIPFTATANAVVQHLAALS
jgi:hypothetical protein